MPEFLEFAQVLGAAEGSPAFSSLLARIGVPAAVTEDPAEYNDPTGATRYYSFPANGILLGVRGGALNYAYFYFENDEGYQPYAGPLLSGVGASSSEADVVNALGAPKRSGGGKPDPLIGYVHKWLSYQVSEYKVRFEFGQSGGLRLVSLMQAS